MVCAAGGGRWPGAPLGMQFAASPSSSTTQKRRYMQIVSEELTPEQFNVKRQMIEFLQETNVKGKYLWNSQNMEELLDRAIAQLSQLFYPSSVMVLVKREGKYQIEAVSGFSRDPGALQLERANSIVHAAAEVDAVRKGIIYVPDILNESFFLGRKSNQATREEYIPNVHEVLMGDISEFSINLEALRGCSEVRSLAAVPILTLNWRDSYGAIVLLSDKENFLNPWVHFEPMRMVADEVAHRIWRFSRESV